MRLFDFLYRLFDRKWLWWTLVVLVAADLTICGFTWGKHRVVVIQGNAWAWVNAPAGAEGMVLAWDEPTDDALNWTPPDGMTLEPLSRVYVTFYAQYNEFSELGFCISSKAGVFHQHTSDWETTKDIRIDLTAEHEGYATVNATFLNKSNYFLETKANVLNIILVPDG